MYCKRNIFELSVLLCVFALVLTVATTVDRQLRKLHHPTNYAIDANRLVGQDLAHCKHYLGSVVEDNSFYEGGFHYYTHNSSHLKKSGITQILLSDETHLENKMQVALFRIVYSKDIGMTWQKALHLVRLPSKSIKAIPSSLYHFKTGAEYKALLLDGITLNSATMGIVDRENIHNVTNAWYVYWIERDPTFSGSPPTLYFEHTIFVS